MQKFNAFVIAFIMTLTISGIATGEIYKWVDENGVIHFADSPPPNVGSTIKVEQIPTYKNDSEDTHKFKPETDKINYGSNTTSPISEKTIKRKKPKVELYSTSWCGYCQKARDFFRSRGISFTEYDIEKDKNAARRKKQLDRRKGVPLVVINGRPIYGFSKAAYERALEDRP